MQFLNGADLVLPQGFFHAAGKFQLIDGSAVQLFEAISVDLIQNFLGSRRTEDPQKSEFRQRPLQISNG